MRKDSSTQNRPASEANSWPSRPRCRAFASVLQPRGALGQQPGGIDLGGHVGELELDRLCSAIGLPNARRSWEYFKASSSARWAIPTPGRRR